MIVAKILSEARRHTDVRQDHFRVRQITSSDVYKYKVFQCITMIADERDQFRFHIVSEIITTCSSLVVNIFTRRWEVWDNVIHDLLIVYRYNDVETEMDTMHVSYGYHYDIQKNIFWHETDKNMNDDPDLHKMTALHLSSDSRFSIIGSRLVRFSYDNRVFSWRSSSSEYPRNIFLVFDRSSPWSIIRTSIVLTIRRSSLLKCRSRMSWSSYSVLLDVVFYHDTYTFVFISSSQSEIYMTEHVRPYEILSTCQNVLHPRRSVKQ